MSIEKITSKIIKEAEDARDEVLADAKEKSDGILAEAKEKAEQHVKAEAERGRSEKEKIISRRKSVAEIDSRKVLLQKKQELIGQCFDRAIEEILSMEEQAYLQLLVNLGKKTGMKEGLLIFNEKEKASLGQKVASALSSAVEGGNFLLAEETRPIRGGYMLQTGNVYINNTIEALVEESKDGLSSEIAGILFSE